MQQATDDREARTRTKLSLLVDGQHQLHAQTLVAQNGFGRTPLAATIPVGRRLKSVGH